MIYDLKDEISAKKAQTRFEYLKEKKARIAIIEKRYKRTINQNSYLHLILSAFALNFGYTRAETKQYFFKEIVNPDIFYKGQKAGQLGEIPVWRSSASLDTKELSDAIDRFLNYSAKNGYALPEPKDLAWITELENEVINNQKYL